MIPGNSNATKDEVRVSRNGRGAVVTIPAAMLAEAGIDVSQVIVACRVAFRTGRGKVLIQFREVESRSQESDQRATQGALAASEAQNVPALRPQVDDDVATKEPGRYDITLGESN